MKPKPKLMSARVSAERMLREAKQRCAEATARGRASHAPKAKPFREPLPKTIKPASFFVSDKVDRSLFPGSLWWYAAYFLNLIRWRQITWRANAEGYSQLHYDLITKVIPRNEYKAVRQLLLGHGIIECDRKADIGRKSFGYRLTETYREDIRKEVCTDEKFNRKIARVYSRAERDLQPVHRWLRGKFPMLMFDEARAKDIIDGLAPRRRAKEQPVRLKEYRQGRFEYFQHFASGESWFTVDPYGRFHTPLTALEGELRCCLRVGVRDTTTGKERLVPLVGIDLANSQPLILCILARQLLTTSRMAKSRLLRREFKMGQNPYQATNQTITNKHKQTTNQTRIKNVKSNLSSNNTKELWRREGVTALPEDVEECFRACTAGRFYESLMTDGEKARGKEYRTKFKRRFFRVLFGENRTKKRFRNKVRARFKRRYPTVAGVLRDLKARNYKQSSYLLQNYEATLFIHRICGRIMRERPGTPLYTIHDSLITTREHVSFVKTVIRDEFAALGVRPRLRKECYR